MFKVLMSFSIIFLMACSTNPEANSAGTDSQEQELANYLRGSYYSSLAKARGDIIKKCFLFIEAESGSALPKTEEKQIEAMDLFQRWASVAENFSKQTEKDNSNPRIKPIRDKYLLADDLFTYSFSEYFMALDPKKTIEERNEHLSNGKSGLVNAYNALNEAYDMLTRALHGKFEPDNKSN